MIASIKVADHELAPPVGARLFVLDVELVDGKLDAVLVDWNGRAWPMLIEHVELIASKPLPQPAPREWDPAWGAF